MLSKAKIKYIHALRLKKYRQKYDNFVVEGDKIGQEILQTQLPIEAIFAVSEWAAANETLLQPHLNHLTIVSPDDLKKISNLQTPNKVLMIVQNPHFELNEQSLKTDLTLVLDGIQDPGNLGTILRIADWFAIRQVILSENCVDVLNTKTIQASMGAFLRVATFERNLIEFFSENIGTPIFGAVLGGENLFKTALSKNGFIVIGNEGNGISETVQQHLTHRIEIPANGQAESLNAAIATGIICAAFRNL
jgi:TrmH family RNA methyltransferase